MWLKESLEKEAVWSNTEWVQNYSYSLTCLKGGYAYILCIKENRIGDFEFFSWQIPMMMDVLNNLIWQEDNVLPWPPIDET